MNNDANLFWISLAIAILLTSVAVLTYWCVRISVQKIAVLPVRHVRQLFFLTFPNIFILSYLVLNEMWLLLVSAFLLFLSLVCLLEFFLRQVLIKSGLERIDIRYSIGKNGAQVSYEEAREASGDYPRHYMTELFYNSMRSGHSTQNGIEKNVKNIGGYDKSSVDLGVNKFSIKNGIRTTSDQPTQWKNNLLFFGGSTTFGDIEVPDDLTFSSFMQRILNSNFHRTRVMNHGERGAAVVNRVKWLIEGAPTTSGDIIVFVFGSNDCGWLVNGKLQSEFRSPLLIITKRLLGLRSEILNWIHGELVHSHNKWCADHSFKKTVSELKRAKKWTENHDLRFLVVLQPNLFVSKVNSKYENHLKDKFSFFLRGQIEIAYPMYEEFVKNCGYGLSLTKIFNNLEHSVFLDWAHVNARGNEIISENFYREMKNLTLV